MTWGVCIILIGAVLVYAPGVWHEYTAPKRYVLALGVAVGLSGAQHALPASGLAAVLGAYAIFTLGRAALQPLRSLPALFEFSLGLAWAYLVAAADPQWILYALFVSAGLVCALALAEFAGYGLGRRHLQPFGELRWGRVQGRRPAGPLGNPDVLGSFSAALLPASLVLLAPFNILVAVIGLLLSQARAAWLAAGLPALPVGVSYFALRIPDILREHSVRERLEYYRLAWRLVRERPVIGHGLGTFQKVAARDWAQTPRLAHVHCEWLEVLHDGGAVGFGLWLSVLGLAVWRLLFGGRLSLAFALMLLTLLIDGLFSLSLRILPVQLLLWTCIGVALGPGRAAATLWPLKLLLLAVPNAAILFLMADRHYKQAARWIKAGAHGDALPLAFRAVQCDPMHSAARFTLAWLCQRLNRPDVAQLELEKLQRYDPYYLVGVAESAAQPRPQ